MTIYVCSYSVSYVIKDQPYWGKTYNTLSDAIAAARYAYKTLSNYTDRFTTIEIEDDKGKIFTIFIIFRDQEAFGKEAGLLSRSYSGQRRL